MKNSFTFNYKFTGIHNIQSVVLFCMLFFSCCSFSQEQSIRYVYSSTTAEAIDELNYLVPDYEKRREVLIQMRKLEQAKRMVFISSYQMKPIQERINSLPSNPETIEEKENAAYAEKVRSRYKSISEFVKENQRVK